MMPRGLGSWWLLLPALAGCTVTVNTVRVDSERINARARVALACAYRIEKVADRRPDGDRASTYANNLVQLEDAPGIVHRQLVAAGLSEQTGVPVNVELMRMYMLQNLYTTLPTVVYQVRIEDGAPFVIRSQLGSMQWSGKIDNLYEGYSAAMGDANTHLIQVLNERCPVAH